MPMQEKYQPIALKRNRTYCAYQFHAFVFNDSETLETVEDVYVRCIVHVMNWLSMKFRDVEVPDGLLDCSLEESSQVSKAEFQSFETREIAGYQLEVISNNERELWTMRLREPDLGVPSRDGFANARSAPLPGRMYETNVGFAICGNNVEFAINVVISEPEDTALEGTGFRPAIVGYLLRDADICLTDGFNNITGQAIECTDAESMQAALDWLSFEERKQPTLLVCSGKEGWPLDSDKLAHDLFGYTQVFAVSHSMLQVLTQQVAEVLAGDILLFHPGNADKFQPDVRLQGHPSDLLEQTIVSQVKSCSTGELDTYGNVLMVADILFERYHDLNEARLEMWAGLDQANQRIAELEEELEALEIDNAETENELVSLKKELELKQQEVSSRQEELEIISEAASQAATVARQNTLWRSAEEHQHAKGKILFIGGGSNLKEKELNGILKSFGFIPPSDSYEWVKYDNAKGFNFQTLIGSTKYSDVIMGSVPHSCTGIGKYESPVSFLRNEEDLPAVSIVLNGQEPGNFTKSNIRSHIESSEALKRMRSWA